MRRKYNYKKTTTGTALALALTPSTHIVCQSDVTKFTIYITNYLIKLLYTTPSKA